LDADEYFLSFVLPRVDTAHIFPEGSTVSLVALAIVGDVVTTLAVFAVTEYPTILIADEKEPSTTNSEGSNPTPIINDDDADGVVVIDTVATLPPE
jgi:hypothetical protein